MRVISGTARGRKLKEPDGADIRPTSDMVKESVFNIVQFDVEGRRVLDLFAGTGQLGIEALSRGAASVVFVDSRPGAIKLVWENLNLCGFADSAQVLSHDALRFLKGEGRFDLVFVDPPYGSGLVEETLAKLIEFDKLNTNGIIICEMKADSVAPGVLPPYFLHREYRYGSVKIVRYERRDVY
ncbi:MAG: 16S rRNA (guanine(966)-N(2))-methyltransferase RsmD [Oscillospiraceae bacterium]|nr:16S rRNA (guanine(966)-N(2))-methyltransferase RsmD [Oscillospiraceae bacterium]